MKKLTIPELNIRNLTNYLSDIRFWIMVLFVIRLYGITQPPLEIAHNWRQTTVAMVARNYLEIDNNLFYPRIDIAGEKTGITGMEFPLLNYFIYLVAEIVGYQHWYGRLINLIVSSFGLLFFYKLLRKYFTQRVSFNATIILAVSVWFQYSRKIMPDTFSMSLVLGSLFYGSGFLEASSGKRNWMNLTMYWLLLTSGILSKLPSAYILVVFALFLFYRNISVQRKLIFGLITMLGLIPAMIWYFWWVPYLVKEYGFWHFFMGNSFLQGLAEILNNIPETLNKFYDTALKFIGFAAFLAGIIVAIIKKEKTVLAVLLVTLSAFLVVIVKSGDTFLRHTYYIIPFVPVMSLVAGYGISHIKNPKLASLILLAIAIEGLANQQHDFKIKDNMLWVNDLENNLDKVTNRSDLFLINSGYIPTPMYFAHRKGWINTNEQILENNYLNELKEKGMKYILILKERFGKEIKLENLKPVMENEHFCLYKIEQ